MIRSLSLTLIISCAAHTAQGQNDCISALEKARQAYLQGDLERVSPLLLPCLETGGFKKNSEQRSDAWRLLGLSQLYLRNIPAADSAFLQFLRLNPTFPNRPYRNRDPDPQEMLHRIKNLESREVFNFGFFGGTTIPVFHLNRTFPGSDPATQKDYSGQGSTLYDGFFVIREISNKFYAQGLFGRSKTSMLVKSSNAFGRTQLSERQARRDAVIAAGYRLDAKTATVPLRFFVFGGISFQKIIGSTSTLLVDRTSGSDAVDLNYSSRDQRIRQEWKPFVEVRIPLITTKGNVFNELNGRRSSSSEIEQFSLSFRYDFGITNQTNPANRNARLSGFDWVEDDFRRSSFTFTIYSSSIFYRVGRRNSR